MTYLVITGAYVTQLEAMHCTGPAMTISFYGPTELISLSALAASLQSKQFQLATCRSQSVSV